MNIPERPEREFSQFIGKDPTLLGAFEFVSAENGIVDQTDDHPGTTLEDILKREDVAQRSLQGAFIHAGAAYLAREVRDPIISTVGMALWRGLADDEVRIVTAPTLSLGYIQFGYRYDDIPVKSQMPAVEVLFQHDAVTHELYSGAYILVAPKFALDAHAYPIPALAQLVWIGSQIRDMLLGRFALDTELTMALRADMVQMRFFREAIELHPEAWIPEYLQDKLRHTEEEERELLAMDWYSGPFVTSNTAIWN